MIKVVLSGIFYPLAMLRYFEAALRRRGDVELFTAGPYTGSWIPWNGGMNLPAKYAKVPNLPLPKVQNFAPVDYIEKQLPWQPDLWLQIDAGFHFRGKPAKGKNVIVGTDPHVLNYDEQRGYADTFYCMQTPYMKSGDEYLPYAYDPIWHAPDPRQPQNFDVCLIGLHYEQRNQLVRALRESGVTVYYDIGPVYDEARALYNQAPIGLNWSSAQDLTARVFELTAMKRLAVVNRVPDLWTFFSDQDVITFEVLGDAVSGVQWALKHPDEAAEFAERGYRAVQPHTWDARIEQVINDL